MSNPHKGGVEFEAQGKTYTLRYSIDAICHLEAATGMTFPVIAVQMSKPGQQSVTLMRQLMHAGLIEHHPELDLKAAGELITRAGGVTALMKKVDAAVALAFPQPDNKAGASGTPNPPNRAARRRRQAGIG